MTCYTILELMDNLSKATDLKHKMVDVLKSTWSTIQDFARAHRTTTIPSPTTPVENNVDTVESKAAAELEKEHKDDDEDTHIDEWEGRTIGKLNQGRRIDYVLQEKPIEVFNDYLFAFASHAAYWDSEDTLLLIMKEIYKLSGFESTNRLPERLDQMMMSYFSTQNTTKQISLQPYLSMPPIQTQKAYKKDGTNNLFQMSNLNEQQMPPSPLSSSQKYLLTDKSFFYKLYGFYVEKKVWIKHKSYDYTAMTFVLKWNLILKFSIQKICFQQKLVRTISNAKLHEVGIFNTLKQEGNYETGQGGFLTLDCGKPRNASSKSDISLDFAYKFQKLPDFVRFFHTDRSIFVQKFLLEN
ncbi:unnamed protein product [Didymodactylos carnosus]|uniref:DDHD domain-containing protein n=1 Tax=Didymodactylos carnosus TaxID=1234261 RepID=A0A813RA05_9BILA|nr:unnamed protein product [Didymodactylos carnosus]CAF0811138.1 unnamed protein product [Didymodactylos carnosus]CAF3563781.1 unnamed protein product [Didymodactylos carnosus]CAF3594982.1 unnamed protein product [Didymodactylos carnosus]